MPISKKAEKAYKIPLNKAKVFYALEMWISTVKPGKTFLNCEIL